MMKKVQKGPILLESKMLLKKLRRSMVITDEILKTLVVKWLLKTWFLKQNRWWLQCKYTTACGKKVTNYAGSLPHHRLWQHICKLSL